MNEKPITPFIPSELDESGLTPVQFRVLCHLWRRGETYSSAKTIAKICKIKRDTVFATLSSLEQLGLIHRDTRKGQTSIILPVPFGGTPTQGDQPRMGGHDAPPQRGHDQPRLGGHKGNPIKEIPLRESQEVVLPFSSDQFRQAWSDWKQHRFEINKKLTPSTIKKQFNELQEMGEDRSIAAINHSIKNGWIGLFEPSASKSGSKAMTDDEFMKQLGGRAPDFTPNAPNNERTPLEKLMGGRTVEITRTKKDQRAEKRDREYPEPKIQKLPRL